MQQVGWIGPAHLAAGGSRRRLARGETLIRQGEPVSRVYVIEAGTVRLSATSAEGREAVVALLGRGELFGELALLGGGPSPVEARALEPCTLVVLPAERLLAATERDPALAAELLPLIAARVRAGSETLSDALLHDAATRVSRRLCRLARDHGAPGPGGVHVRLPLTQQDLARMVGASRETVNRSLASLTARGLVRTRGRRFVITDLAALERAASGSPEVVT